MSQVSRQGQHSQRVQLEHLKSARRDHRRLNIPGIRIRCWFDAGHFLTDRSSNRLSGRSCSQEDRETRTCHIIPCRRPSCNRLHQPQSKRYDKDHDLQSLLASSCCRQPGFQLCIHPANNLYGLPRWASNRHMERLNGSRPSNPSHEGRL